MFAAFLPLLPLLGLLASSARGEGRTGMTGMLFPTPSYTTANGIGYGAFGMLAYFGPHGSGDEPYRLGLSGQYFATTLGFQDHFLRLDLPGFLGLPLRWTSEVGAQAWRQATWFGEGEDLPRLPVAETPRDYYYVGLESLRGMSSLRVGVRGPFELFASWRFRSADVEVYPGSLLAHDRPLGGGGGFFSLVALGADLDTRDREPTPSRGTFSEIALLAAHPLWGSDWRCGGLSLADRRWVPLLGGDRLVLANRVLAELRVGEIPFFESWYVGALDTVPIGGTGTLRGLAPGRLRGDLVLLTNTELRWMFWDFNLLVFHADLYAVPFVDLGRFFLLDERNPPLLSPPTATLGSGLRIQLNEALVARADLGVARERYTDGSSAWVGSLSMLADHPF